MGYRSDVKIITTKEGWNMLDSVVRKMAGITPANQYTETWLTDESHTTIIARNYVLGEWEWFKWSTWDDEVDVFMDTLNDLEEKEEPYRFVRIGEDYNDIEKWEHIPDDCTKYQDMPSLCVERKIVAEY